MHHDCPNESCNMRMQYMHMCQYEEDHQRKLQSVTITSAVWVLTLVAGTENTTSASCWRSGGLGTSIHRRKLERDAVTTCNLHIDLNCSCTHVQVACSCCILLNTYYIYTHIYILHI